MTKSIRSNSVLSAIAAIAIALCIGCQSKTAVNHADSVMLGSAVNRPAPTEPAIFTSSKAVLNARAKQEILLHAALYRAAYESRVRQSGTTHFLLDPVRESDPPELFIDPADFRAAVVSALADINMPIAWLPETWSSPPVDYFPGTSNPATRLKISIINRNDNHATVIGDVGDSTSGGGCSRQRVTATWDGLTWLIDRDRARIEW